MPLRDHFRPPTAIMGSWEAVHGQWPAMLVLSLNRKLPRRYVAHPRVHLGTFAENLAAQDEYEVRVYDTGREQRLVAAIELVSPANKDRPEHRGMFAAKCAALLQQQVSVTIVDLVTIRADNLYAELLDLIGESDPALGAAPPGIYAAACRATNSDAKPGAAWQLETWLQTLQVGQPLPTLPLWLADNFSVPLDSKRVTRVRARLCAFRERQGTTASTAAFMALTMRSNDCAVVQYGGRA
jgi:hypothetical protein